VKGNGYGMGVAVGDYDNDGYPDIFVANVTGTNYCTITVTARSRMSRRVQVSAARSIRVRRCGRRGGMVRLQQ